MFPKMSFDMGTPPRAGEMAIFSVARGGAHPRDDDHVRRRHAARRSSIGPRVTRAKNNVKPKRASVAGLPR